MRWGCIFIFTGLTAWGETVNALSLANQKIGEPPTGFTALHKGTGKAGTAKVVMLKDGNERAIEITGGNVDSNHYTLYRLDRVPPGDHNATIKFRILGGKGVQAAGVFFRMQPNSKDYYLLAVKPKEGRLFWSIAKNDEFVQSVTDKQITPPKNDWHELKYLCKGTLVTWNLNGKEQFINYNPVLAPDYRQGAFGFWVRSDSRVQFSGLNLQVIKPVIQKAKHKMVIEEFVLNNSRLISLQLMAPSPDMKLVIVGSLVANEIGQPAKPVTLKAFESGNIFHEKPKESTIRVVNTPLRGPDGKIIGVARARIKSPKETSLQLDLNYSAAIVKALRNRVPDAKAISIFP